MVRSAMRPVVFSLVFFFGTVFFAAPLASWVPSITKPVNDYAGIITAADEYRITQMLLEHRKKTGVQGAVLTVRGIGSKKIEVYSLEVAEKWGGGEKGRDNGFLFLIALGNRHMRLEVGYGLEGYVPDGKARLLLGSIKKDFRRKAYGKGIRTVVQGVVDATGSLEAGKVIPVTGKIMGAFFHLAEIHWVVFLVSALVGIFFVLLKRKCKFHRAVSFLIFFFLWGAVPVLIQLFFPGVWYWRPFVYVTGAFAGAGLISVIDEPLMIGGKIAFTIMALAPAIASLVCIINLLDISKPNPFGTSTNETILFPILIFTNMYQSFMFMLNTMDMQGGGSGYSSSGSYRSSSGSSYSPSSSGSSGSGSSSYSGGGGSFGGGGASSSW